MKVAFTEIFSRAEDMVIPSKSIRIGEITLTPKCAIAKGTRFDGIDFTEYTDHSLEVENIDNQTFIMGIYYK